MERKTISDLIDTLIMTRERIIKEWEKLDAEHKAKKEDARKRLNPQYLNKAIEELNSEYEGKKEKIRESCRDLYNPIFDELETRARAKAGVINKTLLEELSVFESIPLTADEYAAVLKQYAGRNYYSDRVLEKIAESNGLYYKGIRGADLPGIEPSLGKKLSILKELKDRADRFVKNYGGEWGDNFETRQALFPAILTSCEDQFANGMHADKLTPRQIAGRVVETMRANPGNANRVLDNALENATPSVKNAIINEVSGVEDSVIVSGVKRSKSFATVDGFDKGLYGLAEKAFYSLGQDGTDDDAVIYANSGNVYFKELVQEFRVSAGSEG